MERILKFLECRLVPITEKIGRQRHLQSIRDGIICSLPLILLGSFFLLLAQPPGKTLASLVKTYIPLILIPYQLTFGLIALYVSFTIAYSLSRSYDMQGIAGGLLSLVVFFICSAPRQVAIPEGAVHGFSSLPKNEMGVCLGAKFFGADGLFLAIVVALVSVELLRFLRGRRLFFRMPQSVPASVAQSFEAIMPAFILVVIAWFLRDVLSLNITDLITRVFRPLVVVGDSFFAVILLIFVDSIAWFAGIHPVGIIGPFARPIWLQLLSDNAGAAASCLEKGANVSSIVLPHIATGQYYFWFVWVGGSGASLGLLLTLFLARSKILKTVLKMSVVPVSFNINEPLVFGLPIVANPLMIIPFALAPLLGGTLSYLACALNLVTRPYIEAPWTLPAPLGAFFSTGGDIRALLLCLVVIGVSAVVYYPFVRLQDKRMTEKEMADEGKTCRTTSALKLSAESEEGLHRESARELRDRAGPGPGAGA